MTRYIPLTDHIFIHASDGYTKLGNSDINQYKKFLRRWVFLTVFYKVPFPLQGKAYPYYDRYKSWTTLELRLRKLVGQGQLFFYRKGLERYFSSPHIVYKTTANN